MQSFIVFQHDDRSRSLFHLHSIHCSIAHSATTSKSQPCVATLFHSPFSNNIKEPAMCSYGCKKQLTSTVKQHIQYCEDPQLPCTRMNTPCIIIAFIRHILRLLRYGQGALDTLITIKNHVAIQYPGRIFLQIVL